MRVFLFLLGMLTGLSSFSQDKWRPYFGVHASGNADMYYLGPSFQFGVDHPLKGRKLYSIFIHNFYREVETIYDGEWEHGRYNCLTLAALIQNSLNRQHNNNWFMGIGLGVQYMTEDFKASYDSWNYRLLLPVPVFRLGHVFKSSQKGFTVELNTTGPTVAPGAIFLLSQISIGSRFIF